jgi:lysozyme
MDCFKNLKWPFSSQAKPADVIPIKPIETVTPVVLATVKTKLLGVDVSHYEPALDWAKAKSGGVLWMYTKASEGTGHLDVMLHKHCDSARAAGVLNGAYHFFHASMDAAAQAAFYLKCVDGMKLDLPHCLDWESSSADGVAPAIQKAKAKTWLDAVERATGKIPVIYGGEAFLRELNLGEEFVRYPLWLAHYGTTESHLRIPKPWSKYSMWQWTDAGIVPGLASGHHVDCNWFQGTIEDLKKL